MPEWREINIDAGVLVALILGAAAVVAAITGFLHWDDTRNSAAIRTYANRELKPRIAANERANEELRRDMQEMMAKLEEQENSRDRQYGHLKKQQDQIIQILSDVRDIKKRQ